MPSSGWNGKFLGVGNGGFAGSIGFNMMAANLKRGYATAATDTGHAGESLDASWAFEHPEKVVDFGYRALHETTVAAKSLVAAFYARPAAKAYFDSCSNGGREALMEAQRFPEDYDGILAGAPANDWIHLLSAGIQTAQALYGNPSFYIPPVKLKAIEDLVNKVCDAADGVRDGIISDPERCTINTSTLLCKGRENRSCLTENQANALKHLYAGAHDSKGQLVFPGYVPGSEGGGGGWKPWILGEAPGMSSGAGFVQNYFRYMVYNDPAWTPLEGKLDDALSKAVERTGKALNAVDPDLERFEKRGGKLIVYHGWNDAAISPHNSVNYFRQVQQQMGGAQTERFLRLYMVPGMQHCIGGAGPTSFGQLGTDTVKGNKHGVYDALEQWVERGTAPGSIVATKYSTGEKNRVAIMTRPLCAYPEIAVYKGSGDSNDSDNFVCRKPADTPPR